MFSRLIHVLTCIITSIIYIAEYYIAYIQLYIYYMCKCIYYSMFVHLSVDGHLGCFYLLAIRNKASVKFMYSFFMWTHVFISFVYVARIIIVGSYDKSMVKLFGKLPNCFSKQLYHFMSTQQCVRIPVSPHPYQQLLFFDFRHPNKCEVVSYCAFDMYILMTNGIEYFFMCFLATCM